jgi:hypothetical protein
MDAIAVGALKRLQEEQGEGEQAQHADGGDRGARHGPGGACASGHDMSGGERLDGSMLMYSVRRLQMGTAF